MKERSIGGYNSTCIKTRKTTTKIQDSAWSPTLKCTRHSLTLQGMHLGMPSRSLEIDSSVECSTLKMTLEREEAYPRLRGHHKTSKEGCHRLSMGVL